MMSPLRNTLRRSISLLCVGLSLMGSGRSSRALCHCPGCTASDDSSACIEPAALECCPCCCSNTGSGSKSCVAPWTTAPAVADTEAGCPTRGDGQRCWCCRGDVVWLGSLDGKQFPREGVEPTCLAVSSMGVTVLLEPRRSAQRSDHFLSAAERCAAFCRFLA